MAEVYCETPQPRLLGRCHYADPAETRRGGAVEVERAAELYAQGWTLRQIGAELGIPWTAVGHQLRSAGVTVRRGGPQAHPATQLILRM
jgi:hypothetical protein